MNKALPGLSSYIDSYIGKYLNNPQLKTDEWRKKSQVEVENDLASSSCDCPFCCGAIVPDFESTNTVKYNDPDTSPFDAASSEVTDVPFSGDKNIDSLIYPAKWTSKTITYSFFDGGSYYGSEGNVKPITEKMKGYLREAASNRDVSVFKLLTVLVDSKSGTVVPQQ